MALLRIEPTDPVEISCLTMLLYGEPGVGKTSIAQTLANPYTLDLDSGIHRSFNRKRADQLEKWEDLTDPRVNAAIGECATVCVDTVGRAIDFIIAHVLSGSGKLAPAIQQWGTVKNTFIIWHNQLRLKKRDVCLVAHGKEEKDGDTRYARPDIAGGSYAEVLKVTDLVGFVRKVGTKRVLSFDPTEKWIGKNSAGFPAEIEVPDLAKAPNFLADLVAKAKATIGKVADNSAAIAKIVEAWKTRIACWMTAADFQSDWTEIRSTKEPVKAQVFAMMKERGKALEIKYDPKSKTFSDPAKPITIPDVPTNIPTDDPF